MQIVSVICKGDASGCKAPLSTEELVMVQLIAVATEGTTRNKRAVESEGLATLSRDPSAGDVLGSSASDAVADVVRNPVADIVGPFVGGKVEKIVGAVTKNETVSQDVGNTVGLAVGEIVSNGVAGLVGDVVGNAVGSAVDAIDLEDIDNLIDIVDQINSTTIDLVDTFMSFSDSFERALDMLLLTNATAVKYLTPLKSLLSRVQEGVRTISGLLQLGLSWLKRVKHSETTATGAAALLKGHAQRGKGVISGDKSVSRNMTSQSCAMAISNINKSNNPYVTVLADMMSAIEDVNGTVDALVGQMLDVPASALLTINMKLESTLEATSAVPSKVLSPVKTAIDELLSLGDAFTREVQEYTATTGPNISEASCSLLAMYSSSGTSVAIGNEA